MDFEFIAAGLIEAIIKFVLIVYAICLLTSFVITFLLTRKVEERKKVDIKNHITISSLNLSLPFSCVYAQNDITDFDMN